MTNQIYSAISIRRDYLARLQRMAKRHNRSGMKQVEFLIDEADKRDAEQSNEAK